jgi:plastocyanin
VPNTFNISITAGGNPSPDPLNCNPGDKIYWTNNNAHTIDAFTLPTAVSPQTDPAPIASGTSTREYTVNSSAGGTYTYSYDIAETNADTRNGTIDVS